jgi:hypothetical protein
MRAVFFRPPESGALLAAFYPRKEILTNSNLHRRELTKIIVTTRQLIPSQSAISPEILRRI